MRRSCSLTPDMHEVLWIKMRRELRQITLPPLVSVRAIRCDGPHLLHWWCLAFSQMFWFVGSCSGLSDSGACWRESDCTGAASHRAQKREQQFQPHEPYGTVPLWERRANKRL